MLDAGTRHGPNLALEDVNISFFLPLPSTVRADIGDIRRYAQGPDIATRLMLTIVWADIGTFPTFRHLGHWGHS
mgnify:CR=1 FL=1